MSAGRLHLLNTDFDTGQSTRRGEYSLADDTYNELLGKLADRGFTNISAPLRANLVAYYGDAAVFPAGTDAERKRSATIRHQLAALESITAP